MLGENEFLYDYEKYPLGYVVPDLENKNVEIVKGEKHHGFLNFREAEAWARKNIIRVYYDEETGGKGKICIGRKTINKYLTSSAVEKSDNIDVHLSVLKILPQVIMKSIEVEIHPDFIKKGNTRKPEHGINYESIIHRLFGAAHIGNDLYRVKITLIEYYDRNTAMKPHSYEATKVELLDGTLNNAQMGTVPRSSSSISAAKLLKNVEMSYAKGKYFF
ncbi:MAG: hypothetical protein MJZ90_07975 [Bacteroidales bacterium]|nr:hypothetical protein [Bacteroidales bacterium]